MRVLGDEAERHQLLLAAEIEVAPNLLMCISENADANERDCVALLCVVEESAVEFQQRLIF